MTEGKLTHEANARSPIDVTALGILTETSFEHPEKVYAAIDVIDSGRVILGNAAQDEKALDPIDVTLFGISTDVNVEHPEKALAWIVFTEFGIFIDTKLVHESKT